jgi:hypothetical protein
MKREVSTLAVAAMLLGGTLAGCGGTSSENPTASAAAPGPQVSAALETSAQQLEPWVSADDDHEMEGAVSKLTAYLGQLRQVSQLQPLFDYFKVAKPVEIGDDGQSAGLVSLLKAVRFSVSDGTLTITNAATGNVIFSAPVSNLTSGTFHPENMPNASTPPAPAACTYTYSAWSDCSNGNQTRTVSSATPASCTGTPLLSQVCTVTPPPVPPPPPPATTCTTFGYTAWDMCQAGGTQNRTVTSSSPAGCTGGTPVTSQACTYVPPVTTCSAFTYSGWGACQPNGTQTQTVTSSSPAGCTGGTPVTSQACTYVPPVTTCSAFTYSAWGACDSTNTQTRTVTSSSPAGCTGGSPVTTQACTYVPPVTTCSAFTYSAWGACDSTNTQTRTVTASSPAGCTGGSPVTTQACTYTPPIDGAAQYATSCAGCHGPLATSNLKGKGISVAMIKSYGMTQGLNDAQLQAIVTAVGP